MTASKARSVRGVAVAAIAAGVLMEVACAFCIFVGIWTVDHETQSRLYATAAALFFTGVVLVAAGGIVLV